MLTKIALFNSAALFLDQLATIIISLILTPILISILGVTPYAVWTLLLRGSTYVSLFDGRPHETLKWQIARASSLTDHEKRQLVGANLIIWLSYTPLTVIASVIFVYWVTSFNDIGNISTTILFIAALIMAGNALLAGLGTFPPAILRGSNKGYKQLGVRIFFLIISGCLSIYVLKSGYGLCGLATIKIITTFCITIVFLWIAFKNVSWLGISRPTIQLLQNSYRQGFWYFIWSIVNFGMLSIDVILLGIFSSKNDVSQFTITYYALQTITVAISTALSAALPGLATIMGKGDMRRAELIRKESVLYSWWLSFSVAITALLINQSFVGLWIETDLFAGFIENILIVILSLQMVFIHNDSLIINLALEQKEKVKVSIMSLILTVLLAALLIPKYGIIGLCLSLIIGRINLAFQYPKIIGKFFESKRPGFKDVISIKTWFFSILLLIIAALLSKNFIVHSWISLVSYAGIIFTCSAAILFFIGFDNHQKTQLISRLKLLITSKMR